MREKVTEQQNYLLGCHRHRYIGAWCGIGMKNGGMVLARIIASVVWGSVGLSGLSAWALPASARLFQKQYGYKVSCLLCHADGGGSVNNGYGKAFLRSGANLAAFKKLEEMDSDDDGIKNLAEILAKSNPGDKRSVPTAPGEWLAQLGSIPIPQKELEKMFPGYTKFSALEGSLRSDQIDALKSSLGAEPLDDDKVPTFYFAEKDGKKEAVGQLVSQQGSESSSLATGVSVSTSGKIMRIEVLGGTAAKEASSETSYLKEFDGKTASTLPPEPQNKIQKMIYGSVKRSLHLIQAVFGGARK